MYNRTVAAALAALATAAPVVACASGYSLPVGAPEVSTPAHGFYMILFWVCVAVAVAVFSLIIYSIVRIRQSAGAVHDKAPTHSTRAEVVWTLVPVVILVATASPAARTLIVADDTRSPEMSVMVTGYQWKWHYDYLGTGISFYSTLVAASNDVQQRRPGVRPDAAKDTLLEVDNPLVIPVDTTVRLLLTGNDVAHSWSVPDFAVNKAAIPGSINEARFKAGRTGRYTGQCGELCGRDHAFMPIVVEVLSKQDYAKWLAAKQQVAGSAASGAAVAVIAATTPAASTAAAL
ncbi:MAG TPA: cytochrome c oxidase subunit II [Steroidobacteraceae bacterium]|nr:cytochrome c oxidase subunit II [Steroidobacteraceae bacterium]